MYLWPLPRYWGGRAKLAELIFCCKYMYTDLFPPMQFSQGFWMQKFPTRKSMSLARFNFFKLEGRPVGAQRPRRRKMCFDPRALARPSERAAMLITIAL